MAIVPVAVVVGALAGVFITIPGQLLGQIGQGCGLDGKDQLLFLYGQVKRFTVVTSRYGHRRVGQQQAAKLSINYRCAQQAA
jgi:hypothetical protein